MRGGCPVESALFCFSGFMFMSEYRQIIETSQLTILIVCVLHNFWFSLITSSIFTFSYLYTCVEQFIIMSDRHREFTKQMNLLGFVSHN